MALKEKCRELSETEEKCQTEICHDVMDGEKSFSYSQTHRRETRKPEVQMRVHTEERPFTCQHWKAFQWKTIPCMPLESPQTQTLSMQTVWEVFQTKRKF